MTGRTLVHHAKIYVEKGRYAEALLIEGGRITCVGGEEEVLERACAYPQTEADDLVRIDCGGRTVVPGLNDSHLHLLSYGESLTRPQIAGVTSMEALIERCRAFLTAHPDVAGDGILASGWNQDLFTDEKRMPNRHDLDRISRDVPVVLERVCGHILAANTRAIEMLGLTAQTPPYPGGDIYREADGYPSGLFTEGACRMVRALVPPLTADAQRAAMRQAMQQAVSMGLTSVQSNDYHTDRPEEQAVYAFLRDMYAKGEAPLRYRHQVCVGGCESLAENLREGCFADARRDPFYTDPDAWLTVGPLKLFQDGSLGAHTAMVRDGYIGAPDSHGTAWLPDETMEALVRLATSGGVQVVTHAIGDLAIEKVLGYYERAGGVDPQRRGAVNPLRHAIVHCQITDVPLLSRIRRDEVPVMAQPVFIDYDRTIVESAVGKALADTSYAFGTLPRMGVHLSYGTDCPVEPCDPFLNLYMAVTRRGRDGRPLDGWHPAERVDVETAVDAYTYESAYMEGLEDRKGRLKPGFYADLLVLDRDIFTVDPEEIRRTRPVLTMVGGRVVHAGDIRCEGRENA